MIRRAYNMEKRAAAAGETKRRIAAATFSLHCERGVAATSWQDIAQRAGVAVGTVYYHFPTLDELIPACSEYGFAMHPAPNPEMLRTIKDRRERIEVMLRSLFESYEALAGALRYAFVERHTIPPVARTIDELLAEITTLLRETLGPKASRQTVAAAAALADFRAWDALRERGLSKEVILRTVCDAIDGLP